MPTKHSCSFAACALAACSIARAATLTVDTTTDAIDVMPGDGVCADANGQCTLRAGIQEANALVGEDVLVLGAGAFALSLPGSDEDASARGDLDIADDLVLTGAGAAITTIDGGALDRVLDIVGATSRHVHVERLTLRGGLLQFGSQPQFTAMGAGLRVGTGVLVELLDVDVRGNRLTTSGGAGGIDNLGCLHGTRVRVIDNGEFESPDGAHGFAGGIMTAGENSCLVLEDSEISVNQGSLGGALIVDGGAPATLRRTLVAGNVAVATGALHLNQGSEVLLENVTISGNTGDPGAILNDGFTRLTIVNSTITGNHGPAHQLPNIGGIQDVHGGFGRTFLTNTILSGNGPAFFSADCFNVQSLGGGNLIGDSVHCRSLTRPDDLLDVDPGLAPLSDNGGFARTHLPGANAIDHGVDAGCLDEDQRGFARPQDGDGSGEARCDIGAVEIGDAEAIFADGFDGATTLHPSPRKPAFEFAAHISAAETLPQGT